MIVSIAPLVYGYNQYSALKTEFEGLTDIGTSKIKLPIDSNEEAILIAQNTEEYRRYYLEEKARKALSDSDRGDELFFFVTKSNDGKVYSIVFELMPSTYELILSLDAETGEVISSDH